MEQVAIVLAENMTAAAQWINNTFASFDTAILEFYYKLHSGAAGGFFDFFFKHFTLLGEDGIFLILLSLILLMFKKTRKVGAGMLGGIIIGAVFTNLTIKNIVARPRPYATTQHWQDYWNEVNGRLESEYSFPSGHTTSAMAAMTPVFLFCKKNVSWLAFVFVILMGASRNYLFVHFPSDILGGIIVGGLAGVLAYLIVKFIYNKMNEEKKLGNFVLNFDIRNIFKKKA
jgi:undecaprenyl-diphosphatase